MGPILSRVGAEHDPPNGWKAVIFLMLLEKLIFAPLEESYSESEDYHRKYGQYSQVQQRRTVITVDHHIVQTVYDVEEGKDVGKALEIRRHGAHRKEGSRKEHHRESHEVADDRGGLHCV